MKPIIRVENLSKQYRIGARRNPHPTLRESIAGAVRTPLNWFGRNGHSEDNTIWALRDVSFEVMPGEVIGIIGRNGAGKSTLLKILSRITEPTTGQVDLYGRVGSLLEVGTGFHAELSGRENIYLNGAILGMKRSEIDRKFDEIVAFAEVEKFIDTPVKHYSSGMYMRLAFAVAAHLEPEILMVDEVLAVGDVQFQKKCLGKMDDVARQGRTVLFVSHSMSAVNKLCRYVLWMNAAQIKRFGPTHDVITAYLASDASFEGERHWEKTVEAPGNEKMRLRAVRVLNSDYEVSAAVDIRKPFHIEVEYEVFQALPGVRVACRLLAADGSVVFTSTDSSDDAWQGKTRGLNKYISRCEIPGNFLNEGQYGITVSADVPFVEIMFFEDNVLSFHVEQTGGIGGQYPEKWPGVICPKLNWHVEPL